MNQTILALFINLLALVIALFALYQQQTRQHFYLKIEVEYGHGRQ